MNLHRPGAYDGEGRRKYLSKVEGERFVHHSALLLRPAALFCLTLYYTGCRISEGLTLRSHDIDLEMKTVLFRTLKKRGKNEVRRIPIPEFLANGLRELASSHDGERVWQFSRTTGWRIVKNVMKAAGIGGIHATSKGLRRAFGVRGAMVQIPLPLIQKWMGHADSSTTAIYLAVKDEEARALIGKTW